MVKQTKMIKVLSRGYVTTSRGRAFAPITTPYKEDVKMIFSMIAKERAKVVEVINTGEEIPLTLQNFDRNNHVYVEEKKPEVVPVVEDKIEAVPVVEETKEDAHEEEVAVSDVVEESSDEESVEAPTEDTEVKEVSETPVEDVPAEGNDTAQKQNYQNQYRGNKKKNRNKYQNQQKVSGAVVPESV